MSLKYESQIENIIKNKELFFIFEDFNIEFGGITNSIFKRANYLAGKDYCVNLVSFDLIKNFDFILDMFHESGVLSRNVNFINVYEYYSKKNCLDDDCSYTDFQDLKNDDNLFIKITENNDRSITIDYYENQLFDTIVKSELFIDNVLVYRKFQKNFKQEFFTRDGFRYLITKRKKGRDRFILHDRNSDKYIKFREINDFLYYFMDEICSIEDKPFLFCDSTSHYYNMNGVKEDVYKIGVMHGNPYVLDNEPIDYISPRINHLSHLNDLETLVVLTNEVKDDLINELHQDKFTVIPNFIPDELLQTDLASKEVNKIRIFSRISPEKQIADAISAFKIVCDTKPDAILEIYGRALTDNEKSELEMLKKLVEQLHLEDHVFFKGFLADVNVEMQKSLCTLIISKHEGLPLALLESMANATPVICYDFKYSPKDVITNGKDGIIVQKGNIDQLANEMIRLLDNPQIAIDLGINAREKIKNNFSTSSTGYKWEELMKNVLFNATVNEIDQLSKDERKLEKNNKLNASMLNSSSSKKTEIFRKISNLFKK
ncbi:glycosyltransferase [Methanobrevibacter sp.]|uniref:glycosyltransferase n=1 Tax=Methanobrevibacter sp. TaxID=66852 RepID=UPI0038669A29